ncbi:MAG: Hsp70 family protein [Sandaracinaceae bacterium]|nr:Hsp70 family protein [Sandaracinaceae bacterium]
MFVDRPIGIDLGTTNSEVALLDPSETDLIVYADRFGRRTVPSAVCWDPKKEAFLVGRPARNRRGRDPGPIESIKRKMGRDTTVRVGPHELTPEEVSAKILTELVDRMREHLVERAGDVEVRVGRAVITVPAYFDQPQVEATRKAGELAGLEVLGVLQEPTAAAIYHTWKRQLGDGNFLVYDLGGGTFDVSVLRCLAGEYQVLAIDGDNYLGGDDFDRRYAERLRDQLAKKGYALDLDVANDTEDAARFLSLVHLAQEVKEALSTADVVPLHKQGVLEDQEGETIDLEAEIGRDEWEKAVEDLVETTLACCRSALAQSEETAGVGLADIDHVVLVGGSTRVPMVVRRVTEELCANSKSEEPLQDEVDTCVALGAAVHAAQLGGLRVGDDAASICFRSPLVGKRDTIALRVEVEAAPEGATDLAVVAGADVLAQTPLADGELRLDVPLGPEPGNPVEAQLRDASGAAITTLPFVLYRGDVRPRASSLSQPSVIAKDIALEVLRAGRRERKVLLSRGTGLPAEITHTFFTGDKSGAVVLRLLQNRLPIKTLMLTIDEGVPVGSPVELTLRCDEAMRLEAKAVVAGQELWAKIEPAPQKTPGAAEVEQLLSRAETAQSSLWGHDAHHYRREVEPLVTGIREVLGTDLDKLAALCAKLDQLLDAYGGEEGAMTPPMHRFEGILDLLRRIVYRTEGPMLGMGHADWEARIADLTERGVAAWDRGDPGEWRRVYNEAQALQETVSEQEFSRRKLDDPAYVSQRMISAMAFAKRIEHELADFVPSAAEEVRELQLRERDRLLGVLQDKVHGPLGRLGSEEELSLEKARRQLDTIVSELNRIDTALEKLPAIGLVTERGR